MKILGKYKNGNVFSVIFSDGTLIRKTDDDEFRPDFATNMDIKLCNRCDMGCSWCHEGSTPDGKLADIMNEKFIDTLHPYQEVALGGGDITSHPDLVPFLQKLKDKRIISNVTVNQRHFEQKQDLIKYLIDNELVYGIGVSLVDPTDAFINLIRKYDNAVIHVINGIFNKKQMEKLYGHNLKILILGYKILRRGKDYANNNLGYVRDNMDWLNDALRDMFDGFKVVSFDNLAIEQLNVKRLLSDKEWEKFYMGKDGTFTYYIDMVDRKFAESSTAPFSERYDLLDSVDDMFKIIQKNKLKKVS